MDTTTLTPPATDRYAFGDSPIGRLLLTGTRHTLTGLYVADHPGAPTPDLDWTHDLDAFADVRRQLDEYFAGTRSVFDLPLALHGTSFQVRVWEALLQIPYGQTWSYGQLAAHIGNPAASRAVGLANGRNPISIVVPCHRVIGADGSLTGYGWGTERKSWLLRHEAGQLTL